MAGSYARATARSRPPVPSGSPAPAGEPCPGLRLGGERLQRRVERLARAHHGGRLLAIDEVVATEVHALALRRVQLADDLLLVAGQALGKRLERVRELLIVRLVR